MYNERTIYRKEVSVMAKSKNIFSMFFMVLLSCLMVLGNTISVFAATNNENGISPLYTNISYNTTNFNISGIKAECKASVSANKSMNLKIKMELQKEKSNGYETVETWTSSKTGIYLAMSESRNINILSTYRLKVTFTAGSETEVVYRYK